MLNNVQRLPCFGLKDVECGVGDRLIISVKQTPMKSAQTIVSTKIEFNFNTYRLVETEKWCLALIATSAEQKADFRFVATRHGLNASPGGNRLGKPLQPYPARYAIVGGKQVIALRRDAGMQVFFAHRE